MKKNSIIAVLLSMFTVLFLSDFKILETIYLIPSLFWVFPLFGFYYLSVWYFSKAFSAHHNVFQKVMIILVGGLGVISLFYIGFSVWKMNHGNVFLENQVNFQVNLKNIFFWIVYQSYILLFFMSSFKQLVTIDQK